MSQCLTAAKTHDLRTFYFEANSRRNKQEIIVTHDIESLESGDRSVEEYQFSKTVCLDN